MTTIPYRMGISISFGTLSYSFSRKIRIEGHLCLFIDAMKRKLIAINHGLGQRKM